jgi:hypothetical protein
VFPQALKRDGYRCRLSGRLDANTQLELLGNIDAAALAATEARDAAADSTAAPSDFGLAERAATLAKKSAKLDAAAKQAATFLASFQDPTVVTNAVHIFSESTNADVGKDAKVRRSGELYVVLVLRLPEGLCF